LDYSEGAVMMSQRIIDFMLMKFDNPNLPQEDRDRLGHHYHH